VVAVARGTVDLGSRRREGSRDRRALPTASARVVRVPKAKKENFARGPHAPKARASVLALHVLRAKVSALAAHVPKAKDFVLAARALRVKGSVPVVRVRT
jgi:hypothetical protein